MAYSEKVLEHYEKPRNIGSLDSGDSSVGTALVGAPECGDVMKLQIKVDKDEKIIDAKFKLLVVEVRLQVLHWQLNGLRVSHWMKHIQFKIHTSWKNFLFPLSRFIVLFLLRTQLMLQSVIIKIERLLIPSD